MHREGSATVLRHAGVVSALVDLDNERVPRLGFGAGRRQRARVESAHSCSRWHDREIGRDALM